MAQPKIAIRLASLKQPFARALATCAQLGVRAVELDARTEVRPEQLSETGLRDLRRRLDDFNLGIAAFGFRTRRGYDQLDDLDRRIDATKAALAMAGKLRVPIVLNHVGQIPPEAEAPAMQTLIAALTDLGRFGLHHGALLVADTGAESGADLARLLARLPDRSLGVSLDPGSLIVNGFSPLEAITALGPSIVHVYARDGVRDLARRQGREVRLGSGAAEFPALVAALESHAYHGYFTVAREHADDPAAEIARAVQFVRSLQGPV